MTKTVKELIDDRKEYFKKIYEFELDLIEKDILILDDILKAHEKELAEKEQEINSFKQQIDMAHNFNQNLGSEIEELKQQQLYKEHIWRDSISCEECEEEFTISNLEWLTLNKFYKCQKCKK